MPLLLLSEIVKYFSVENVNAVQVIEKGENALNSEHLLKFELGEGGEITAIVRRSYIKDKNKAYLLKVSVIDAIHLYEKLH